MVFVEFFLKNSPSPSITIENSINDLATTQPSQSKISVVKKNNNEERNVEKRKKSRVYESETEIGSN
jgi:hypothetical protein